jgi:hypothetical protein
MLTKPFYLDEFITVNKRVLIRIDKKVEDYKVVPIKYNLNKFNMYSCFRKKQNDGCNLQLISPNQVKFDVIDYYYMDPFTHINKQNMYNFTVVVFSKDGKLTRYNWKKAFEIIKKYHFPCCLHAKNKFDESEKNFLDNEFKNLEQKLKNIGLHLIKIPRIVYDVLHANFIFIISNKLKIKLNDVSLENLFYS